MSDRVLLERLTRVVHALWRSQIVLCHFSPPRGIVKPSPRKDCVCEACECARLIDELLEHTEPTLHPTR